MLEGGWLQVFQRIPHDYQDTLSLVSVTGAELVVQQVFRIERDFVVVRARTAGTLDGGRMILVPYSQIDFLAFNRKMVEEEVTTIFGAPFQPVAPVYAMPAVAVPSPLSPMPLPAAPLPSLATPVRVADDEEPPPEAPAPKPGQISKTILLARLRERLAEKAK